METVTAIDEVRQIVKQWRKEGESVGFVPTMGYLHEGHGSLIARACENDKVVVSIFVNPTQFAPNEDLESYPRDLKRDKELCKRLGADLIFNPSPEEMYAQDFCSYVDMSGLTENLCGASRHGHFSGVCTVVTKLFNIVRPDKAYFGQKDAQQLAIIKQMVSDLNMDVEVIGCPIVRENDGLAKSSRNTYLNENERHAALVLSSAVKAAQRAIENGERDANKVITEMTEIILKEPLAKIDYIKAVDGSSMCDVDTVSPNTLLAMAVYIGKTRLIDNLLIS